MNLTQIGKTLLKAVFKVLRGNVEGDTLNNFLKLKVGDLLDNASPTGWPTFWKEVLLETVRREFRRNGVGIANFDVKWFDDNTKTMRDLRNHIRDNQFEVA